MIDFQHAARMEESRERLKFQRELTAFKKKFAKWCATYCPELLGRIGVEPPRTVKFLAPGERRTKRSKQEK